MLWMPKKASYFTILCQALTGVVLSLILSLLSWEYSAGCGGCFLVLALIFAVAAYFSGRAFIHQLQGLKPQQPRYFTAVDTPELPPVTPVVDESDDSSSLFL